MSLREYHRKRNFRKTPEPRGRAAARTGSLRFVVQKHAASRLHYDFRLELDGVLKSWAVPKGPSLDPSVRSLAVQVEDHPLEYAGFEGVIPEGEYGGGTVIVWDEGEWEPIEDPHEGFKKGRLKFALRGQKLQGIWNLVRMHRDDKNWLLIKHRDEAARPGDKYGLVKRELRSVATGRDLDEVAQEADRVWTNGEEKVAGKPRRKAGGTRANRSRAQSAGRKTRGAARTSRNGAAAHRRSSRKGSNAAAAEIRSVRGAQRSAMPRDLRPQLATLEAEVPEGEDWLHEMKFDGYRILCFIEKGQARLITRKGNDWTERFPHTAEAAAKLPVRTAILDGELVAVDEKGISRFQELQNFMQSGRETELLYYVFDLPYAEGYDLRAARLEDRKEQLDRIVLAAHPENDGSVRYSDHIRGDGRRVLAEACRGGLEGIISKHAASPYESRRTRTWLKIKCHARQEFVIGGFTRPKGTRTGFGALLLGYYEGDQLLYCGRVGTGFDQKTLRDLTRKLKERATKEPPFVNPPRRERSKTTWVRPELVAEVEFSEWTEDGILRHPSFQGLREDKDAREVVREKPGGTASHPPHRANATQRSRRMADHQPVGNSQNTVAGVTLTNPDRVLYPDQGITKQRLAEYYASVADWVLPHLVERALTLVRCPQGSTGKCFYQKHWKETLPDAVDQILIQEKDEKRKYVVIHDLAGLISLVQINALEIHPWGSRIDKLESPDRIVFDLDPGEGVKWSALQRAAHELHAILEELELESFLRTSGGKGLHILVPLQRRNTWDEVSEFAHHIASVMAHRAPDRYVDTMRKQLRKGKIYIDYLRNQRGATAIASYSTRARQDAPVATPVRWDELDGLTAANQFTIENVPPRLEGLKSDPWEGFENVRQSLSQSVRARTAELARTHSR